MTAAPQPDAPRPQARRRIDPRRIARWVWRLAPLALVAAVLLFYFSFGVLRVPAGMDSMEAIPPGSLCLIDKRSGSVQVGSVVFADLPDGGTVLSRVTALAEDGTMTLQNDNASSALPDSDEFGGLPPRYLRGVVLVVFAGDGEPGEVLHGR